jgi:FixJ family two-component response regulator
MLPLRAPLDLIAAQVNAVLSQPEIEQRFGSLVTDVQMAGMAGAFGLRQLGQRGLPANFE